MKIFWCSYRLIPHKNLSLHIADILKMFLMWKTNSLELPKTSTFMLFFVVFSCYNIFDWKLKYGKKMGIYKQCHQPPPSTTTQKSSPPPTTTQKKFTTTQHNQIKVHHHPPPPKIYLGGSGWWLLVVVDGGCSGWWNCLKMPKENNAKPFL